MASTLKVNTIAHTGGTTAQTIDSSGRILTPARPAFRAYCNTNLPSADYRSGTTQITFNTESYDIGGNYNTSNGKFIVPITGLYQLRVAFYISSVTTAQWVSAYIFVGNTQTSRVITDPQGGEYGVPTLVDVLQLTAGNEVTAHFACSNDDAITIHGDTDGSISYFGGYLIG